MDLPITFKQKQLLDSMVVLVRIFDLKISLDVSWTF